MPSARVVEFVALLREHGFTLGVQEQQAMLSVAAQLGVTRERSVAAAWRAIACQRRREWRLWPELYEGFWHPQRVRGTVKVSGQTRPRRDLRQAVSDLHAQMAAASSPANAAQSHASADAPATKSRVWRGPKAARVP